MNNLEKSLTDGMLKTAEEKIKQNPTSELKE